MLSGRYVFQLLCVSVAMCSGCSVGHHGGMILTSKLKIFVYFFHVHFSITFSTGFQPYSLPSIHLEHLPKNPNAYPGFDSTKK